MSPEKIKTTVTYELKSRAKKIKENYHNPELTLGNVQEALAQYYGFKDWNTAFAKLKDTPFNSSAYPAENSERLDRIINKILDGRRNKCDMSYRRNHNYITFLKKCIDKGLETWAPINWDDFVLKINLKFSDDYIFSVNRMLANVYHKGLFNE
ncbi:TPA: hypothetical protein U0T42_002670 [Legionella pneumophila]|uniref:glyoxalase superfamily protein n=1 Tax=Legionella pneumophila TaxID=446 RepID=UPI000770772B|nr:glyoxalase superfamily protein [Legionella pneumophila]CZJ19779.1 Uncharacterised protein [Legionella pneumophila]HAT1866087.1 hypothetical protein [Legionella pneumophila]HAT7878443.1 hypothetical protein [Legionella pneumophila]HAU0151195.1 hypothetical protein [Legionella pneumophila]HAU1109893.1 hypothetical protein [Legionella pneumophila]